MKMSSTKRGSNYSQEEITFLLATVRKHLPIGQEEWKIIAHEHNEQFPFVDRCFTSLRKKFNSFANARMPTGQPHCPPNIIEAKRILESIKDQADIETFNNTLIAEVPTENDESKNSKVTINNDKKVAADVPNEGNDATEEQSNTSTSSSTASIVPTQLVSPRLQRISMPRKKNSQDEMSVQEFFKFSMLQREEYRVPFFIFSIIIIFQ